MRADDPMAEVAPDEVVVVQHAKTSGQRVRRNRYYNVHCKHKVLQVSMPERAPETGIDEGHRIVHLYCEDRKKIWLCSQDADWALEYLRDQLHTKGVMRIAPGDRGPGARPEPASPEPPIQGSVMHLVQTVTLEGGLQSASSTDFNGVIGK